MSIDLKTLIYQPIVPQSTLVILMVILLWQIYSGVGAFFSLDKAMQNRDNHQTSVARGNAKNDTTISGLKVPFFGDYVPININAANVKPSMLDLKIVGILFSTKHDASQVIIQTAGGTQQTFNVGDTLPGGAILRRITADGVLIGRHGSLESLSLPKESLTFEPPPKPLDFRD